jgi:hypothetical protein
LRLAATSRRSTERESSTARKLAECQRKFRAGYSVYNCVVQVLRSFNEVRLTQDGVRVLRESSRPVKKFHVYPSFGKKFPQMEFTNLGRSPIFVEMPLSAAILGGAISGGIWKFTCSLKSCRRAVASNLVRDEIEISMMIGSL